MSKFVIFNDDTNKVDFIDTDKSRLVATLAFIDGKTIDDIKEVSDDSIELSYDGLTYYRKGFCPQEPSNVREKRLVAEAEAQRVPDLEDATVDLATYIAELDARIAELEAAKEAKNG